MYKIHIIIVAHTPHQPFWAWRFWWLCNSSIELSPLASSYTLCHSLWHWFRSRLLFLMTTKRKIIKEKRYKQKEDQQSAKDDDKRNKITKVSIYKSQTALQSLEIQNNGILLNGRETEAQKDNKWWTLIPWRFIVFELIFQIACTTLQSNNLNKSQSENKRKKSTNLLNSSVLLCTRASKSSIL